MKVGKDSSQPPWLEDEEGGGFQVTSSVYISATAACMHRRKKHTAEGQLDMQVGADVHHKLG
jgi:hypothetical protein